MPLDLKSTLNLPKTDFSMKANLPQNEPKMLARWEESGSTTASARRTRAANLRDARRPTLCQRPDPSGHALNKTLKDFVVKSRSMSGFDAPYVPGWDCHGLPIEIKVDDLLGRKKLDMDPLAVREECRKYAQKYLDLQREQFKRIGVFGRWDKPYSTMDPQYESVVLQTFYSFYEQGLVYKGLKSVYWCIHDKTALAEAEVEYEMHTSPSIWVRYPLTSDPAKIDPALAGKKNVATIIWTTTPWTLPASMAVTFAPDAEYVALDTGEWTYIVAKELAQQTIEKCGVGRAEELAPSPAPSWSTRPSRIRFWTAAFSACLGDYVTMDTGTGAVHTAPAHGADDFSTGVKYGIELRCDVDDAGILRNGLPEYDGQQVFKANPLIVELLKSRGVLLGIEKIEHSYPHCWRCHNPIIFRATEQWFISMERQASGRNAAQPRAGRDQEGELGPGVGRGTHLQHDRHAPRLVHLAPAHLGRAHCHVPVRRLQRVSERQGRESRGGRAVRARRRRRLVPASGRRDPARWNKCAKCGGTKFRKEMDIIDVWFESGSSQAAVLGREPGLPWPADLYLEGGDQHRGWFHSSLLCAVGTRGGAPYRRVATVGWTLDPQGRAMSKSLGNTVDPVEIADKLGAEIVRLWVASVDFREDVMASDELMQRIAESYRKIRNTFRYILGNLDGFDPERDAVTFADMHALDQYILLRAAELTKDVREHYDTFIFHRLYQRLKDFCIVDLSAIYFDVLKDRLYTSAPKSQARRSAQTALWRLGEALVRLLAPVMSFTAEEVWGFLPVDGQAARERAPDALPGTAGSDRRCARGFRRGRRWRATGRLLLARTWRGAEGAGGRRVPRNALAGAWRPRYVLPLRRSSTRYWSATAISCATCSSFPMWCWRSCRPATATPDWPSP